MNWKKYRFLSMIFIIIILLMFIFRLQSIISKPVSPTRVFIPSKDIKCILSDIDGTLVNSYHILQDRTLNAISRVINHGYRFYPCTGRSRKSMASVLGPKFVELFGKIENIPGVFQQGLTVYGPNNTIIYERFLDNSVISKVIQFCEDADVAVIAYAGDDIYTQKQSYYSSIITEFQEPLATVFQDGLNKLHTRGIKVNKLVIINDEKKLIQIRPKLAAYLGNDASLTKAIPVMLEVLPSGASKGYGVNELLKHMKIPSEQVLAFGDGENDIEMLSLVGEGIAVNNAKEELKKVAKFITTSNDDYGVATILEMLPSLKYPSNHFRN